MVRIVRHLSDAPERVYSQSYLLAKRTLTQGSAPTRRAALQGPLSASSHQPLAAIRKSARSPYPALCGLRLNFPYTANSSMPAPSSSAAKPNTTTAPDLARELGVSHATAIVVGTIIGSGIFLVPSEMMQAVGSAKIAYLAWVVGGLLSFFGALTYAELGAMKPQAGGEYVYVRDGYGPLPAFLYAWTWFAIAKPASIATITTGLVRVLGNFPSMESLSHQIFSLPLTGKYAFALNYGQLVAIGATI